MSDESEALRTLMLSVSALIERDFPKAGYLLVWLEQNEDMAMASGMSNVEPADVPKLCETILRLAKAKGEEIGDAKTQ